MKASQRSPCSNFYRESSNYIIGFLTEKKYVVMEKKGPSSAQLELVSPHGQNSATVNCIREARDQPHVTGDILSTSVHFSFLFSGFILDSKSLSKTGIQRDIQTCQQHWWLRGLSWSGWLGRLTLQPFLCVTHIMTCRALYKRNAPAIHSKHKQILRGTWHASHPGALPCIFLEYLFLLQSAMLLPTQRTPWRS